MILKNKNSEKFKKITYTKFRKRFVKEIRNVFESYSKTQLNKYSYTLNYIEILITSEILICSLNLCDYYLYISSKFSISTLIPLSFNNLLRLLNNEKRISFLQSCIPW